MNDFDTSNFDLEQASGGRNKIMIDDLGNPSVMVSVPALKLSDTMNNGSDEWDPAFIITKNEKKFLIPVIWAPKFQNVVVNDRAYSLARKTPTTNINLGKAIEVCKNKGDGWHLMSNSIWASIARWSKKNGTLPYGNNNYGSDANKPWLHGEPATYGTDGRVNLIKTGTGGAMFSHDGTDFGIMDLNGNVWEWVLGVRLVYGELQVLVDIISTEWKALNAKATSYTDLFVTSNGSGATEETVKLDYISSHWQWQNTTILSSENSSRGSAFASITYSGLSDFCRRYIQALALGPDDNASAEDYGGDDFWANNGEAERCAVRGGGWTGDTSAGVFFLSFGSPSLYSSGSGGFRSCYYDPDSLI